MTNTQIARRIKSICKDKKIAVSTMLKDCGINQTYLYAMENRDKSPSHEKLSQIADYLNVSVDYLLGRPLQPSSAPVSALKSKLDTNYSKLNQDGKNALVALSDDMVAGGRYKQEGHAPILELIEHAKFYEIPLLGDIACGSPILAEQNFLGTVKVDARFRVDFALICKGDSMINARIYNGDTVYIRQQPDVENGEIAAVLIDNEATLKRVYKFEDYIELRPENTNYDVLKYAKENASYIKILGKAVAFLSVVR